MDWAENQRPAGLCRAQRRAYSSWRPGEFRERFLPRRFRIGFQGGREAVVNIKPTEPKPELQANKLALMRKLDAGVLDRLGHVDQLESAIANYELAFRMQSAVRS